MSLKKIENLEKKIESTSQIDAKIKEDLLDLMRSLKTELSDLKNINPDTAHDIAEKTQVSAEKILSSDNKKNELQENIDSLQGTVEEFEVSHPKLVQIVNRLCMMLSDIGI
jgi:mevalonate kinase